MNMKRCKLILLILLVVWSLPLAAQERTGAADYLFRFVPGSDMFYVPWSGNGENLDSLLSVLTDNGELLRDGRRYICVSSYGATAGGTLTAARMAYLRCQRVKSELITRAGVTEAMFVTDRYIAAPYNDTSRNVVVVTFPASVEKVAEIAGPVAAAKVEAYNKEVSGETERECLAAEKEAEAKRLAAEQSERERLAREKEAQEQACQERLAAEQAERERAEAARLAAWTEAVQAKSSSYSFALRANLLRWVTLTPDLGVEWRIDRRWSVLLNSSWTLWSWSDKDKRYALWKVSPEVRYYIGKEKRGFLGAMYHTGEFNYKLGNTGKQGGYQGGGITGGYMLPLNRALALDFHATLGYTYADYDKYKVTDGIRVRQGSDSKNYWGVNQLGVTLVWKFNQ